MCLLLLSREHRDYSLILLSNRDEYYHRATQPLHRWTPDELPTATSVETPASDSSAPEHTQVTTSGNSGASGDVYAGRDTTRGGTWLAVTSRGRLAALTNFRESAELVGKLSRGALPIDYVTAAEPDAWLHDLAADDARMKDYGGFSLLCGRFWTLPSAREGSAAAYSESDGLTVLSNRRVRDHPGSTSVSTQTVLSSAAGASTLSSVEDDGATASLTCELSNAHIEDRWPKCESGRVALREVIHRHQSSPPPRPDVPAAQANTAISDAEHALVADLFDTLSIDTLAQPDIPSMRGSVFIRQLPLADGLVYGTRQQTVLLVRRPSNKDTQATPTVVVCERTLHVDAEATYVWQTFTCEAQ